MSQQMAHSGHELGIKSLLCIELQRPTALLGVKVRNAVAQTTMQRSVLRPGYLTQTLQSATCRHWHVHSLSSLSARNYGSHRRPLRAWFPVQARKGLSELLSLSDKP